MANTTPENGTSAERRHKESLSLAERNRRNAALSTGPRTAEGRAISRYNATRHGLLSQAAIVGAGLPGGESREELEALLRAVRKHFRPVGELEALLVDRFASCWWRLRRAVRIEADVFNKLWQGGAGYGETMFVEHHQHAAGGVFMKDGNRFAGDDVFSRHGRYEARISREFYRALRELDRAQAARRGEHPGGRPVAVNVAVTGTPGDAPKRLTVNVPPERVPGAPEGDPEG